MSHLIDDRSFSEDHLIQQLYQTMRVFSKTLNNTISDSGIYSSEWTILKLVREHGGISQSEIIDYLGVEPAAISKTLSRLEKKQIIERRYLPGLRGKHIFLTSHGEELFVPLEKLVAEHRERAVAGLSLADQRRLFQLMQQVHRNLSPDV